ncbi:hypothetical protein [Allokutzneria albata]|uniref:Galactose oxidase, central domain n=1 Tax=Allokutzneria albata TaxID=211114 RepID=A0A1G9X6M5_ALLAB|nr:hypothetical protein [Allokutzneria albata]SDM91985.1 hypothetical protein SAMN04489726_4001 [Allokutzneria albata]
MRIAALVSAVALLVGGQSASWTRTPVPIAKGDIAAVATLGDRDAWALGYRLVSTTNLQAVALRWDGRSWAQESTLPAGTYPQAIAVAAPNDIWEAGSGTSHWNGRTWTKHALEGQMVPEALAAVGGRTWVVGMRTPSSIKDAVPDVQTWDGTRWRRQPLPPLGKGTLSSIVALSPTNVWAAGHTTGGATQATLVVHWDGRTWRKVDSPGVVGAHTWVSGLAANNANEVWAVGGTVKGTAERPFAMRWDGSTWTATPTPDVADGRLRAVARAGADLWAVGGKGSVSVALRWDAATRSWATAPAPDISVRGLASGGSGLWAVGLAKQGDLVPAITRYQ